MHGRLTKIHAGGKWLRCYDIALGAGGNLDVDLNFMYGLPLWPVALRDAEVGSYGAKLMPVLDLHEIAAGKLAALLDHVPHVAPPAPAFAPVREGHRIHFDTHACHDRSSTRRSCETRAGVTPSRVATTPGFSPATSMRITRRSRRERWSSHAAKSIRNAAWSAGV